tara:strand:+ start:78 stop:1079 length:1002 start_codon:yes stop_codon:yes gene_type:complete
MAKKPLQNFKNLIEKTRTARMKELPVRHGLACQDIDEPVPFYEQAPCEKVISGKNNTMIILGRDRPSHRNSGLGGRGATQCGKIDLIAGLASSFSTDGPPDSDVVVSPNFSLDASRIYISQKTKNIDSYMGLAPSPRDKSKNSAAIGIKSDCIRIIGRKNIKIVTGKIRHEGLGKSGERNASGGKEEIPGTISFIAGNYTEDENKMTLNIHDLTKRIPRRVKKLQALVKGDNLIEALEEIIDVIDQLASLVENNNSKVLKLAQSYAKHQHISTIPGVPVAPTNQIPEGLMTASKSVSQKVVAKVIQNKITFLRRDFLKSTGPLYINSKYVYTN